MCIKVVVNVVSDEVVLYVGVDWFGLGVVGQLECWFGSFIVVDQVVYVCCIGLDVEEVCGGVFDQCQCGCVLVSVDGEMFVVLIVYVVVFCQVYDDFGQCGGVFGFVGECFL